MVTSIEWEKSFTAQIEALHGWPEDHFLEPICAKKDGNGPPSADQMLSPEAAMLFVPKSQGHCQK